MREILGLLRAPVLLSRPTPPHVPPISPRARAAPSPRPRLGGWVTVGVTVADPISGHPGPSPLCHRHTRALLSHEFVRLHAKMSSLLKLFFEDSSSDDDDGFEMMILSLFAATMSNKRPKHCGSLRRRALVCRKKSRHAKLMEDQSQLPTRRDQSSHCHLAASSRVSSRRRQIGFAKECVTEMPRALLDCRPCKQPRLGWDVGPAEMYQMAFSDDDDILDQWLEQEESDDDDYYIAASLLADVERERSKKHCDSVPGRQVQIGLCGQEVVNAISAVELGFSSDAIVSSPVNQEQPRDESPPLREDDKYGRYVFAVGDNLTSRYRINAKMGQGTFGQVLECWDRERKEMVAIKITRGTKTYRDAAMIEIGMLEQLGKYDKSRSRSLRSLDQAFLRKNNYRSFPIALVREVAKQLLECVAFMHELRLIHTDLKPENILVSPECIKVPDYKASFRSPKEGTYYKWLPKSNAIKVIDFGSTTYDRQDQSYVVSTRHYRAPEVILGLGWSYPCDIWSVGCILVELCMGEALFQTGENLEHLAMMERVFGPLPYHMLKMADRHSAKYIKEGRLNWPGGCTSWERMKAVTKLPRLQSLVMRNVDQSAGDIIDLLQGLLEYDPANRLTAQEALRHPFFTEEF